MKLNTLKKISAAMTVFSLVAGLAGFPFSPAKAASVAKTFYFLNQPASLANSHILSEAAPTSADSLASSVISSTDLPGFRHFHPGTLNNTHFFPNTEPAHAPSPDSASWISDTAMNGVFEAGAWQFIIHKLDDTGGEFSKPHINVYLSPSNTDVSSAVFLFDAEGPDWWNNADEQINFATPSVGPFTFNNEYLVVQLYDHCIADCKAGKTLGVYEDGNTTTAQTRIETPPFTPVAVQDTTAPVISINGANPANVMQNTGYTDAGATAADNIDGDLTANIATVNSVNTAIPGTYTVTYDVSDAALNVASQAVRIVTVTAVAPTPTLDIITITTPASKLSYLVGEPLDITNLVITGTYSDNTTQVENITAANIIGFDSSVATVGQVLTITVGTQTATYAVGIVGSGGGGGTIDTTPPIITILGNNPASVLVGGEYIDAGATATDNVDGNLTAADIVITGLPISTAVVGAFTATYTATDAAGNIATATRIVNVTNPPSQLCVPSTVFGKITDAATPIDGATVILTNNATQGQMQTVSSQEGFYLFETANLNPCLVINDNVTIQANLNNLSGSQSFVHSGGALREINIAIAGAPANQPPVVSVNPDIVTTTVGGQTQLTAEARDINNNLIDPQPQIVWSMKNGDTGVGSVGSNGLFTAIAVGLATVEATMDGVIGTADITVNDVVPPPPADTTAPVITISGVNPINLTIGDAYVDAGATALDDVDGNITGNIVTTGLPVSTATVGSFNVTYSVSDTAGNSSSATRTINVALPPAVLTAINVTPASAIVGIGGTQQLSATTLDQFGAPFAAPATWSSSNPAIATVDAAGLVRGVAVGAVTVSATSGAVTSSANITVPDAESPVISITGGNPATITVRQAYNDAGATARDGVDGVITDKIVSVSNVNNNEVGTYFVTYTVKDTANNVTTIKRTVNVQGIVVNGGGGGTGGGGGGGGGGFFSGFLANIPGLITTSAGNQATPVAQQPVSQGRVLGESTVRFNANMGRGARGGDVKALQLMLQEEGFFSGSATGFFGPLTQKALVKFQKANNINPTGFLGPLTRAKINSK